MPAGFLKCRLLSPWRAALRYEPVYFSPVARRSLAATRLWPALALAATSMLASLALLGSGPETPAAERALGGLIRDLSEPGGYFDTDNLISNETSYLQAADQLEDEGPRGGLYLGVGPDQSFSYMARLRPDWAFILDVRRDNMLQHLYLNALLARSPDPYRYLCGLLSRPCGDPPDAARAGIEGTLAALERVPPLESELRRNLERSLDYIEGVLGVPLDTRDRHALREMAGAFFEQQLGLRFRSHGRPPMPHHPTLRSLLLARSPSGRFGCFLDSRRDYDTVRKLALGGRIVPVVGNFAGDRALRAVGDHARRLGQPVSAFYVSNVEFYLLRDGTFPAFVENVRALPLTDDALFIRAYFDYGRRHPARLPGHRSTTVVQSIRGFLEGHDGGRFQSHWDVATAE